MKNPYLFMACDFNKTILSGTVIKFYKTCKLKHEDQDFFNEIIVSNTCRTRKTDQFCEMWSNITIITL